MIGLSICFFSSFDTCNDTYNTCKTISLILYKKVEERVFCFYISKFVHIDSYSHVQERYVMCLKFKNSIPMNMSNAFFFAR